MHVQHLDPESFIQAYGVDLQVLYPWEGAAKAPFGAAWAILAPGEATKEHKHNDCETFFVAHGQGEITIDGEISAVGPGTVTFHDPFQSHTLTNTSPDEDLMFLTVWWEDRALWHSRNETPSPQEATDGKVERPRRTMVTAAPPTPNGDLHLGHLSGPYLSSDFFNRYQRVRGRESYLACGTDDHCMHVERLAEQLETSAKAAADDCAEAIEGTLASAGIGLDVWMRPGASKHYLPLVHDLFHRLYEKGDIEARNEPRPFCVACDQHLYEADYCGNCSLCAARVWGNSCEECGRVNDAIDLVDLRCTKCDTSPEMRPLTRLVFKLSEYTEMLRAYHRSTVMNPQLRALCEAVLEEGLPDIAISHVATWGVSVPWSASSERDRPSDPTFENQTLYVWFEMAARYWAYAQHTAEVAGAASDPGHFWRSGDADIVQFFGVDNSFWYAVFLPALYHAYDSSLRLPTSFITNEFYHLDGEKFSTSRDHRILGRVMAEAVSQDVMRFYLGYSCPEREATNFTVAAFEEAVERELCQSWQVWLLRLGAKVRDEFDGSVPATGDWTDEHRIFYQRIRTLVASTEDAYEPSGFSPQKVIRNLCELVREARRFGSAEDHWRNVANRSQERRTAVALELVAARTLAFLAAPVMPDFADRLWKALGLGEEVTTGSWETEPTVVPDGQRLGDFEQPFFVSVRGALAATRTT